MFCVIKLGIFQSNCFVQVVEDTIMDSVWTLQSPSVQLLEWVGNVQSVKFARVAGKTFWLILNDGL